MNLLALETSTRMGSIALLSDGRLISEYQTGIRPNYSEMLLPLIEQVVSTSDTSIEEIDMFAVAQGPGSFTALRIGISVILGLSIATDKKIVPVPSLDGLAYNAYCSNHLICPMLDARRGEIYYAFYRFEDRGRLQRITPYRVASPDRVISEIDETVVLLGDGIAMYRDRFVDSLGEKACIAPGHLHYPRASAIGAIAMQRMSDFPDAVAHETIVPLYVRPADAEAK
jgi:tRNA threonylcarbamoyladenosine biosynthesis protein TsaB